MQCIITEKQSNQTPYYNETKKRSHDSHILTHTSNAKYFRNVTLINTRGLAEIIVPFTGYGRHSPNQVMIEME